MNDDPKGFICFLDNIGMVELLTDEEAGRLFKALYRYSVDGRLPDLPKTAMMAFVVFRNEIDRNAENYRNKKQKLSEAGRKGAEVRRQKQAQYDFDDTEKKKQAVRDMVARMSKGKDVL